MILYTNLRSSSKNKSDSYLYSDISSDFKGTYIFEESDYEKRRVTDNLDIETVTKFKDFERFYNFPFDLYKDDPNWVAPFFNELRDFFKKKNPFWNHSKCKLFIAKTNNNIVGRIAAIIDYKYCETVGEKIGYFGFFECIQDFTYAEALLQSAEDWLVLKKMNVMRGPINGRIDIGCGFLHTGFDSPPTLLSSYSPSYYISFAEKFDMKKARDLLSYYIDLKKPIPIKLKEKALKCSASGIKIRQFDRLQTKKELKWWIDLFLQTIASHWGYVPVSHEEVKSRFGVKQLRWIVDPKLFLIAEFNSEPVAYIWSTPDFNQIFQKMNGRLGLIQILQFFLKKHRIKIGKLHFIGIKKEFRNQNIGSCLNYKTLLEMKNRGFTGAEVGLIDEGNSVAHTTIAITGAKVYKKYRVFEKKLQHT